MSKKNIIIIVSGCVVGAVLIALIIIFGFPDKRPETVAFEVWGVFDDKSIYKDLIAEFSDEYPQTKITYVQKSNLMPVYENDLLESMAAGKGPDILMINNSWLPRYKDKLMPVSSKAMTQKEYKETFVDVTADDFIINDSIYALPLSVDTLALYYNKDIFNSAEIAQPPVTWDEFMEDVEKLTVKDENSDIIKSAAALGTAVNINRSTDILTLLMLQSGTAMVDLASKEAVFNKDVTVNGKKICPGCRALEFYTDFANPQKSVYTWNTRLDYSIDMFYQARTAMMLNYSYHVPTIQKKSPYLKFGVAEMPQIKDAETKINYANYWAFAVAKKTGQDSDRAWEFILWLSRKENAQKYLQTAKKPASRRDLIDWQKDDEFLGIFSQQALTARSWYQVNNNDIETIFADMIESIVLGKDSAEKAIAKGAAQVSVLIKRQ